MIEEIRSVGRTCRGPYPTAEREVIQSEKVSLLNQDKREDAAALDARSRIPCGYDFNETIVAGPLDGQAHKYECPKCGLTGTYQAPLE